MKNFTFLKPLFTQGFLFLLGLIIAIDALVFLTLGSLGSWWAVSILQLIVIIAYLGARNFKNPDKIPWGFALKWWPEEKPKTTEDV